MKRYVFLLSILVKSFAFAAQAGGSDHIIGLWKSPDERVMIKIVKVGDYFQGRIVWVESGDRNHIPLDRHNPDHKLRKLPLKGNKIIKELSFDTEGSKWIGGVYYNPHEGKHYNCQISLHSPGHIQITKFSQKRQNGIHEIWSKHD